MMNVQFCALLPLGPCNAASTRSRSNDSGTGSGLKRRIARQEYITSKSSSLLSGLGMVAPFVWTSCGGTLAQLAR
jgi:hypothetical protein